ncbi:MAG: phosphonate ABC transporter, permease protein PhnE [Phycisphaeraceae bacterium]|nr:phosphonate ABC transporter, permease protein PhnE [Phycisphaeraceae bacterium]
MNQGSGEHHAPPRWPRMPILGYILLVVFLAMLVPAMIESGFKLDRTLQGIPRLAGFFAEAFPPNRDRLVPISWAMLETAQMALVGVTFGVLLSLPLSLLAARNTAPSTWLRMVTRSLISTVRTIPDLVWAMIFIIAVGIGPQAGILTIMVDTIGFCGRFFSERIEETSSGPAEALTSTGAPRHGVIIGAILPEAFPSFVGTSLYAVEKAMRSAVILGIVGAGGIGVELSAAMGAPRYDHALTIILVILAAVILVEQISSAIRRRII